MPAASRPTRFVVARGILLAFGVVITTVAFVGLVETKLLLADAAPWWYLGLVGLAAMLIALGSPRNGRVPTD